MGGFVVGSSEIVPKAQINYLCSNGFAVVIPNYRLAPQTTGKDALFDAEEAYDWATTSLPSLLEKDHGIYLDTSRIVAMGHSSGGAIAMHLGSCKPLKAVTAFSTSLYTADVVAAKKKLDFPPFNHLPDFHPTEADWEIIAPKGIQLSEAPLAAPGTIPPPRNKWQLHLIKYSELLPAVMPDGDYAAIDPMTRVSAQWPPTMIVQGGADAVPGSTPVDVQRAEREMREAGVKEVELVMVPGEAHVWDLPPTVGTSDLGPKWQAVVKGLDWLRSHV